MTTAGPFTEDELTARALPLGGLPRRMVGQACLHGPTQGRGPVVLCVHGGYHGAWCYERWVPLFAQENWSMAALDMRGHGGLPQSPEFAQATISDFADDVLGVVRALGEPPALAAHSMGAAVAALAATRIPVAGLVLLAPSPPGNVPGLAPLQTVAEGRPYGPVDEAVCRRRFFPHHDGRDIAYLMDRLCPESPVALNERRRNATIIDASRINAPSLLISAGLDDPTLHADGVDRRTAEFFNADLREVPAAGHCLMIDGDVGVPFGLMMKWLKRHFPRS